MVESRRDGRNDPSGQTARTCCQMDSNIRGANTASVLGQCDGHFTIQQFGMSQFVREKSQSSYFCTIVLH